MAIKKLKPRSPSRNLGKTIGDNTLATIADVNQLVDQINKSVSYKVYTALLTQSGGDDVLFIFDGDSLIIGVTYEIFQNGDGFSDFTNVGAPNNDIGTTFVATGTTPNSWGNPDISTGTLKYNTGAPVATVLENTIGNIWFGYIGLGVYAINSSNLFINNKTYLNNKSVIADDTSSLFWSLYDGVSEILIGNTVNGSADNSLITNHPIEIRVYN